MIPFLSDYSDEFPRIGEGPFFISRLESKLRCLVEDYYAKRAGGEPEFLSGVKDFTEGKNTKPISVSDNMNGDVKIVFVKNADSLKVQTFDEFPLNNTFYGNNCKELFHLEVNGNHVIRYNNSFFASMANFFNINLNDTVVASNVSRYYKRTPITSSQDFLLESEVYFNTGIKPTILYRKQSDPKQIIVLPKLPDDLDDLINKFDDRLTSFVDIINYIGEFIKEKEGEKGEGK